MATQELSKEYYMEDIPVYSPFEKKDKMTPVLHAKFGGKVYRYSSEWHVQNGKRYLGYWIEVSKGK